MEKRHRRGLSKQAILDSCFCSLVLVYFSVFDGEIKRAGGRALSLSSRPPASKIRCLFFGGITSESLRWILVLKSASTSSPDHPSTQRDPGSRSGHAIACVP